MASYLYQNKMNTKLDRIVLRIMSGLSQFLKHFFFLDKIVTFCFNEIAFDCEIRECQTAF